MSTTVLFQFQSAIILGLIFLGVSWRAQRTKHVRTMMTAILWDILLIAQIEFSRHAVEKASKALTNPMLLNIHVSLAVSCVVLYALMGFTGLKLLDGQNQVRPWHKKLGWTTVVLRTLVFITSFFAVSSGGQ